MLRTKAAVLNGWLMLLTIAQGEGSLPLDVWCNLMHCSNGQCYGCLVPPGFVLQQSGNAQFIQVGLVDLAVNAGLELLSYAHRSYWRHLTTRTGLEKNCVSEKVMKTTWDKLCQCHIHPRPIWMNSMDFWAVSKTGTACHTECDLPSLCHICCWIYKVKGGVSPALCNLCMSPVLVTV